MHPTLEKLKERKLVQWALAYFAGAFVVVGLLDGIVGPLGLSQGVHQTLLALLVVGFPIALVSAWHHGERGNQRVTGPELVIIACLLGVGALGLQVVRARPESLGDPRPGPALPSDDAMRAGLHATLAETGMLPYGRLLAISPDGRKFLVSVPDAEGPTVLVSVNWAAGLRPGAERMS